jgi:mRNA-degrading endonuclease RelE of RelBE toxin-antitoxin system
MEIIFSDSARREMEDLEQELQSLFIKHLEKMQKASPRKHMKYDIPCHVEKATKQVRIVYDIKGDLIYVLHLFASHKEYERWYQFYK